MTPTPRSTPRSRRGPTASHQARAGGTLYIFTGPGLASCRQSRLNSNVRRHQKNPMRTNIAIVLTLLLVATSTSSNAQEAPRLGILYNLSEMHSLTYNCTTASPGALSCEFVQTSVRPKSTFADLPAALQRARSDFAKGPVFGAEDCKLNQKLANILGGKEKPPKEDAMGKLTIVQKKDMLALTQGVLTVCNTRSEEKYLDLVRLGQDRDRRTCKVSALSFTQTFRVAPDSRAGTTVWLAQSKPDGPCGIVQLSRFESEQSKIGTMNFTNWRYVARKAITNPTNELLPGASCSGFDEAPYTYDWRSQEHQLTCDYIEFSPI